ncbi:MAG: alpha/beta hydrolase fold protein [Candidatus Saccharibacteria bacterium]|nr:alpha/beta hydrolase fold protein [Candidatus Saccharibacteria bacterium]
MNIVVNDLLVNYRLTGTGKLVVLLHGWGDSLKGLSALHDALSEHYQVVALDLPGFGATQPPATVWDLDNYAGFVRDFLAKLDLPAPYALVGHSNGGALAVRAISTGCVEPSKLVLVAASGVRDTDKGRRLMLKAIAKTGNVATIWLPERHRQKLRKQLYGVAGSDLMVVEHLKETFKKTVRQDVQKDAAQLKLPTLLVYAADDKAVPLAYGQKFHSLIDGSKMTIIKDAEHFVHIDQPAQVTAAIEEFLA